MSEERLQEIKDSIEFQYTLAKAKGYDNALLFTNEEEEWVEEIERLNNIINELEKYLEKTIIDGGTRGSMTFWYRQIYDYLQELKGSDSNVKD